MKPLFIGMGDSQVFPMVVTVENKGPDTAGEVVFNGSSVHLHYPIQLPKGTVKQFIAYPSLTMMDSELNVDLFTSNGNYRDRWPNTRMGSPNLEQVLTITDNPGESNFMRSVDGGPYQVTDLYAKPDLLPDRGAAYGSVSLVILGSGAERISDSAVAALKEYVLAGGSLLFVGGAAPQSAKDPRWFGLCPVVNPVPETIGSARLHLPGYGQHIAGPLTAAFGTPAAGTKEWDSDSRPIAVAKPFGAGTTYFLALNPYEEPLMKDPGREQILSALTDLKTGRRMSVSLLRTQIQSTESSPNRIYVGSVRPSYGFSSATSYTSTGVRYPGDYDPDQNNPFNVALPDAETVAGILFLYFLLVAPINLIVLKRLKRGELAWITAPVISLVFAGLFFRFAMNLYAAHTAKQSNGLVIADSAMPGSYIFGRSQLFFPRGGSYDLKLDRVEYVSSHSADDYGYYGGYQPNRAEPFDAVDNGHTTVPGFESTNLGFYQIEYDQQGPRTKWVSANVRLRDRVLTGEVTNHSPYTLSGCAIYAQGSNFVVDDLKPGETRSVRIRGEAMQDDPMILLSSDRFLLRATVTGFDYGPQIGATAPGGSTTLVDNLGALN